MTNRTDLIPIGTRWMYNVIVYIYISCKNCILDCPEFLSYIDFKVFNFNSRNILTFYVPHNTKNYVITR